MVTVNGNQIEWEKGMTVTSMLEKCRYTFPLIIVTVNGEIIPRKEFDQRRILDGDSVEAFHLMSGG